MGDFLGSKSPFLFGVWLITDCRLSRVFLPRPALRAVGASLARRGISGFFSNPALGLHAKSWDWGEARYKAGQPRELSASKSLPRSTRRISRSGFG